MLEWPRRALTPPPGMPILPSRELDHRHGADVLRADRVLRPAQRVQNGADFGVRRFRQVLHTARKPSFGCRQAADQFRGVAGEVGLHQVPHAARMARVGSRLAAPLASSS